MTALTSWHRQNDAYLAAALEWLRLLLRRRSDEIVVNESQVADAELRMRAAASVEPSPALIHIAQSFGLSEFEILVLLLCASMELDTRIPQLCAQAQDDASRPFPTFALAMALFPQAAWEALSPERPLRYWRLLEIDQRGVQPLTSSALRADERIVNCIKGLNYIDDRIASMLEPIEQLPVASPIPLSAQAVIERLQRYILQPDSRYRPIQLVGPNPATKLLIVHQALEPLGLRLYRLAAANIPATTSDLDTLARLWNRETLLLPVALFIDGGDLASVPGNESGSVSQPSNVNRLLQRLRALTFLDTRESGADRADRGPCHPLVVNVPHPTPAEQRDAWSSLLGDRAAALPARLTSQFNLELPAMWHIAETILTTTRAAEALEAELWKACQSSARPRLDTLAQRLDAKAHWEDIVLPDEATELLRQIAAQVGQRAKVYGDWGFERRMNRGMGISALFTGESGTGKTMAAEVIANDLQLTLYRIDLSAVVSKYIGETEKNLRRLFDAADDGGAILFFDEADALFGKRSEVKDSHDRYANIEINYLLQRIEAYRGLAILATNMKGALDAAFTRRLRFIVDFSFPGPVQRRLMWRKAFPPDTPTAGLEYDKLARLDLAGGSIHAVALNAAFIAAGRNSAVTLPIVLEAARAEFRKLNKSCNEADLRPAPVTLARA